MAKFGEIFHNLVIQSLNQVYGFLTQYGPGIVFAISVIILGWIFALIVKKIVSKLLKALGFNVLAEKVGLKRFLDRGEIKSTPSVLVGLTFYWIMILNALIMASDAIDLKITSQFIQQIILYLPKIIAVVIFLALAAFISKFIYNIVEKTAHAANIPLYKVWGNIARYATFGLAIMIILEYLGLPASTAIQFFTVIFIVVPVMFFISFLIGGKDIITNMFMKRYIIRELKIGDIVTFDSISGEIQNIDFLTTKLKTESEEIIVPNSLLAQKIIRKLKKDDGKK